MLCATVSPMAYCVLCRKLSGTEAARVVGLYAPLPGYVSALRTAAIGMRDTEPSVPLRPGTRSAAD